ncbi:Lpp/OprI family alanine-zipper lipoprotein [uncultured Shewanella sp.]|uniref:Lpp/OprI family alanine-zipper lipoprotein n=1 Tax=uncultured Shewanella sp. TaxID=173975 RepID=UPI002610C588|nr:Lpp/OprI family alanine-zipper lipoprotein [uncultured Shewanella sp.]
MNKKVLMIAGVAMTVMLGGCASTGDMEKLSNKVDQLSAQVNAMSSDQAKMAADMRDTKAAAMNAEAEAKRANDRIDNIASSYSK